ncbi:hypothetical protein [Piscinibacterium candidicorallinum]|uniref:HNH endonuclease n=1 Tax=Piscinibacterium candidicorallinum TaxID=1793872 RepID=A0ABV7H5I4_9BURK
MNRWNIPDSLEQIVKQRDLACVYCGVRFGLQDAPRGQRPSWEHIINDARIVTAQNIALCCISCNASKGAKPLHQWLMSSYCRRKLISESTVAPVVRAAIIAELSEA